MLGKNLGKSLIKPRPLRKRALKGSLDTSSLSSDASAASALGPDGDLDGPGVSSTMASHKRNPVTVPRKFGSDLSAIHFADAVEPGAVEVVLQCELFSTSCVFYTKRLTQRQTSCFYFEAVPVPLEGTRLPGKEGRGMDRASNDRSCLPPSHDIHLTVLLRQKIVPEVLSCQPVDDAAFSRNTQASS